jgi:hypothetical protein
MAQGDFLSLSAEEIVGSVRSLFADGLQPFGRVVLKRLRERAAERAAVAWGLASDDVDPETMPRIDPKRLRAVCEACRELVVKPEEGKEYSVSIKGERAVFLDVTSAADPYSEELWEGLSTFVRTWGETVSLPGGRYAAARELIRQGLAFLEGLSLAEVCHVVHLATTKRRVFGYRDSTLVNFEFSSDRIKAECASAQAPTGKESLPAASWEQARSCLRTMVNSPPASEPAGITISNVKRLFRAFFSLELSETALGHIRLVDLLRDGRFCDVFQAHEQTNGQLALRQLPLKAPPGMWNPPGCISMAPAPVLFLTLPMPSVQLLPCVSDFEGVDGLLSPGASPRGSPSSVQHFGKACSSAGSTVDGETCWSSGSSTASEDLEQDQESEALGLDPIAETSWTVEVKRTFIDISPTSTRTTRRSQSLPNRRACVSFEM